MQELVPYTRYKNASSFIREAIDLLLKREDEQLRPAPPASSLESHVWRLREDFSRNERASWYQSTLFGRRRRAAQQRGAIAAALHRADGALGLLERRVQGLSRGGENQREEQGERGNGPHGDRSSP
jgi:Arc/MetJ-type ribon-helix-helix transcriptional regulator